MEFTERNLITRVWTLYHSLFHHACFGSHLKLTQSTAMDQKRFNLRSLSPALRNLWLLLVITLKYCTVLQMISWRVDYAPGEKRFD